MGKILSFPKKQERVLIVSWGMGIITSEIKKNGDSNEDHMVKLRESLDKINRFMEKFNS